MHKRYYMRMLTQIIFQLTHHHHLDTGTGIIYSEKGVLIYKVVNLWEPRNYEHEKKTLKLLIHDLEYLMDTDFQTKEDIGKWFLSIEHYQKFDPNNEGRINLN